MRTNRTQRMHSLALIGIAVIALPGAVIAIVNGGPDGDEHPNVGATVWINQPADRNFDVPRVQCSGTLIHPRVFLTAGHCTFEIERRLNEGLMTLGDMRVSFGNDAYNRRTWHEISNVITHPDYDPEQNNGSGAVPIADVGVVILDRPVRRITPVTLAPEGFLDFLDATGDLPESLEIVGYGALSLTDPDLINQRDGLRRVGTTGPVHVLTGEWVLYSQNTALGDSVGSFGDSGGAVLWTDPVTGEQMQVAVMSRIPDYRVDIPRTEEFVEAVIELVEAGEL